MKRPDNSYEQFSRDMWRGAAIIGGILILIFVAFFIYGVATADYDCSRYDPSTGTYVCEWR